ncbi:phosphoribosylformylglycinamidine cyclo-ligase, chloroplastic [Cynara cardunculus var. scolymus]|uniref:phosphoribosylformylglycinamidine cyclo-ligase, chloroplastic n=1 Tax=Cynara cardunculus var. scolymus TaxID=59895 RepID=UPI000D625916|nr:phosphoribosylformylglycinamidine cyclo-ligase, chloroplastic [Cynara cardunculus var. scolymus]XP_024996464.1 phosphoribosylformylglycinamidine cyclo-ligase, chloroplastic [Cynara cardunculus var. scolymus]
MSTTTVGTNLEISKYAVRPSCQKSYSSSFYASTCKFFCLSRRCTPLSLTSRKVENRKYSKNEIVCLVSNNLGGTTEQEGLTYKEAGVDIDAGSELVRRIAKMAPGIGGFGGLFPLGDSYLVAGTDGVGTKLKLAFETGIHDTIGIDLVAMSVNDIITSGAKPLFFLDYFATSHLDVDLAEKVIKGIVNGCQQSDCALLGGETAEMPDFYANGEYDLSGFAVGIVKKESVINGKNISVGDVLIGLPSSGVHSNGFSLVRRVLARSSLSLKDKLPGESITLGEALMAPTVIYVKQVLDIISKGGIKGIAHITGGGFTDNIPRVFPKGLGALVYEDSWPVPPVFKWIQKAGMIEDAEMKRTFNMGIGMVLVASKEAAERILNEGETAYRIGEVISGDGVSYR